MGGRGGSRRQIAITARDMRLGLAPSRVRRPRAHAQALPTCRNRRPSAGVDHATCTHRLGTELRGDDVERARLTAVPVIRDDPPVQRAGEFARARGVAAICSRRRTAQQQRNADPLVGAQRRVGTRKRDPGLRELERSRRIAAPQCARRVEHGADRVVLFADARREHRSQRINRRACRLELSPAGV